MRLRHYINICLVLAVAAILAGCVASPRHPKNEKNENERDTVGINVNDDDQDSDSDNSEGSNLIIKTALSEMENEMYSITADTTFLYWLKNKPIILRNTTKCNIFALNTLFKAGYKTPKTNALARDLYNDDLFKDIIPVVKIKSIEEILKGDLVVWKGHVIIFESLAYIKDDPYAKGLWAGTSKKDNGTTVKNNVMHGKYPLKGEFVVRRPQKAVKSQK
ncbi:MAG: hypothetical protein WCK13_03665 [Ignavibacteriota bacterium]|nr:hypothetical protein [Ignavibacteriota bacterium]